jgi:hypothetical protein
MIPSDYVTPSADHVVRKSLIMAPSGSEVNEMSQNAAPQPGDVYLLFNCIDSYAEIPSMVAYSVADNSALTVSAWIRPDVVNFPNFEGTHYVHWMGKGEGSGSMGQQEWAFRMYNPDDTQEDPPRPNRISFYVFNLEGGLGVGSYVATWATQK